MTKWSYHVFKFSPAGALFRGANIDEAWLAQELNALGAEGWDGEPRIMTQDVLNQQPMKIV